MEHIEIGLPKEIISTYPDLRNITISIDVQPLSENLRRLSIDVFSGETQIVNYAAHIDANWKPSNQYVSANHAHEKIIKILWKNAALIHPCFAIDVGFIISKPPMSQLRIMNKSMREFNKRCSGGSGVFSEYQPGSTNIEGKLLLHKPAFTMISHFYDENENDAESFGIIRLPSHAERAYTATR